MSPLLDNPRSERVRAVRSLSGRSVRARTGRFLVEGPQAVREAVAHAPGLIRALYVTPEAADRYAADIIAPAHEAGVDVHQCTSDVVAAMADTSTPQGLVAVADIPGPRELDRVLDHARRLVLLFEAQDPGNLGTVIRGADAAGLDAVLVSTSSVDPYSPKVVRATAGSLFHLPVLTGVDPSAAIAAAREAGLRTLATTGAGDECLPTLDLRGPHLWVMGNEARGLPDELLAGVDAAVRVPIYGQAESLNLAMAATLCMYASAQAQSPPG